MLMDMLTYAAKKYPRALSGWNALITESHQAEKHDKSGTAIAIGREFKKLGVHSTHEKNIRDIRNPVEQILMGIPKSALGGHGWHQYDLLSPDENVRLGFTHNVNGRETYIDGTLTAIDFLAAKVANDSKGECFSMIDVMRG
jgi:4-hydroxy-tetrahydrodipicolinate reductase